MTKLFKPSNGLLHVAIHNILAVGKHAGGTIFTKALARYSYNDPREKRRITQKWVVTDSARDRPILLLPRTEILNDSRDLRSKGVETHTILASGR